MMEDEEEDTVGKHDAEFRSPDTLNITWEEADDTAMYCCYWHQAAAQCAQGHKRN